MPDEGKRDDPGHWFEYPRVSDFAGRTIARLEPVPGPSLDLAEELLVHFDDGAIMSVRAGSMERLVVEVTR